MIERDAVRRYVEKNSDEAFGEIMDRYMNQIYWTCWRDLQNAQMAEDATQTVFILFAGKARSLKAGVCISGWLFNTARFVCRNMTRRDARRHRSEEEAARMMELSNPDVTWREVEPWLNDGLSSLGTADREALLLRYFDGFSLAEVADALGIKEEAARQRVSRAISRLRRQLTGRKVAVAEATLAVLIAENAGVAAPDGCRAAVVSALHHPAAAQSAAILQEGTGMTVKATTMKGIAAGAALILLGGAIAAGVAVMHARRSAALDSANSQAAESVLQSASTTLQGIHSLQADISEYTQNRTNQSRVGTISLQRPNLCASQEMITYYPSGKVKLFEWRSDGTHEYNLFGSKWTKLPDANSVADFNTNIPVDPLPIDDFFDPASSPASDVEQLRKAGKLLSLKLLPDEPASGGTTKVVEYSSPDYAPGLNTTYIMTYRYYIFFPSSSSGGAQNAILTRPMPIRAIEHSSMGWTMDDSLHFTQIDQPIPRSVFAAPM